MSEEHKSYGYEGGFENWTADKVVENMRIMQDGKPADVEDVGKSQIERPDGGYGSNEDEEDR